jgi:hypothetical protein
MRKELNWVEAVVKIIPDVYLGPYARPSCIGGYYYLQYLAPKNHPALGWFSLASALQKRPGMLDDAVWDEGFEREFFHLTDEDLKDF